LLEVLDPEQNSTFRDAYLGVPFDLSKLTFIATANVLDTIPGPLRDRMEIIELPGYTESEKVSIALTHLVKKQIAANGLKPEQVEIGEPTLRAIVREYTREAGVRGLERRIAAVCRYAAVKAAQGEGGRIQVSPQDLAKCSGRANSRTKRRCAPACPGSQPGSPGRRSAAMCCSSKRPARSDQAS